MAPSGIPTRRRRLWPVALVVLVAGVAAGVWWWLDAEGPTPDPVAAQVAALLADGTAEADTFVDEAATVAARHEEALGDLASRSRTATVREVRVDEEDATRATARFEVRWELAADREWSYEVAAPLTRDDDGWRTRWDPTLVHPDLGERERFALTRTRPERADVLGRDGTPLVTDREVVDVGLQPSRIEDVAATTTTVRDLLELDLDGLEDRVAAAEPDHFVPVVTLREAAFTAIEAELRPVPGVVLRRDTQPLAPTAEFARATLGRAGPVTAELLEEHPDRYTAGDTVGLSGLQRVADERLGGRPGLTVSAVPADDDVAEEPPEADPRELYAVDPEDGVPVTVTLEEPVQRAADDALADLDEHPSALVAIDVPTGDVLAVANGPANGGRDLALTGRYPPGSIAKILTTAALLAAGTDVDTPLPCPDELVVDGRAFGNASSVTAGERTLRSAFADSCNTAFIAAVDDLDDEALATAASWFGLDREPTLGVPAGGAEVPVTEPGTDRAAAAIGQGRLTMTPLAAADMVAAVVRGAAQHPTLVVPDDGADASNEEAPADDAADDDAASGRGPMPEPVADALPGLLRAAVAEGTGQAVRDVPGGDVVGKTGTAEFGDATPPRTHAWFVGAQDDLAFAVLVADTEDGSGGGTAAPLAARFLAELAG